MSRSNRIGLFGCSNLYGYHHAFADAVLGNNKLECLNSYLDEHVHKTKPISEMCRHGNTVIKNYAFPGCGNTYINEMLRKEITELDYVFVQFTGLTRVDIPGHVEHFPFQKNGWIFSGGVQGYWKQNATTKSLFSQHYDSGIGQIVEKNITVVRKTLDLLEQNRIAHNWCFYYDIRKENKEDHGPTNLDTNQNFITPDPHTYCFSKGKGADDGVHFMYDGYRDWLYDIKDQLHLSL
jgi:hypothetical protein